MDEDSNDSRKFLESDDSEVEVVFWTKIKDERLSKAPEGTFMIQTNSTRRELSHLLNSLLETEKNVSFDFLIDEVFLRTTISEYMKMSNKTSEVKLNIEYLLTLNKPFLEAADKIEDWIRSVCCSIRTDNPMVISGSYDGIIRFYDILSHTGVKHTKHEKECESNGGSKKSSLELNVNNLLSIEEQPTAVLKVHSQQLNDSIYSKVWVSTMNGCIAGINYYRDNNKNCQFNVKNIVKKASFFPIEALCTFGICENIISAGDAVGNIYIFSEDLDMKNDHNEERIDINALNKNLFSEKSNYKLDDVKKMSLLNKNKPHSSSVTDLMSNGEYLLSASLDGNIKVTNIYNGETICGWNSKFSIFSISSQYSSSNVICTSHDDGKVRIWDIRSGNTNQMELNISKGVGFNNVFDRNTRLIHRSRIFAHIEAVPSAQWSPFNNFMIGSVSHDKDIKILDIRSPSMPLQVAKTDSKLLSLCWVNDRTLYTGGSSGELIVCTF
ncbi:microtubule-associated protein [Cryptosporidium ryanae]|uniref:microtubule-associated protein n=1 Tax=Cryptosporidium ryanae TaxID=515981 RepID=UPI00351A3AF8|nr:microtubule-associated protein [Cryptosporidium ryanae]